MSIMCISRLPGSLPAHIVKCVVGLGLLLGIKTVLKPPMNALFGGDPIADAFRYAIVVFFAAGLWRDLPVDQSPADWEKGIT